MQTVSSIYLEGMGEMVRKPSRMRLTFHYPTGDIVYTNADIVKVTEKKTAHLIAGELPAIELEMELVNLDGSFNPNDISGLHDLIIKGVPVTYEFGYDIPNLQYYGYTDGGEHNYGMEENVHYGFMEGYATEWIPGGEVFTSGEISYSKTTATISAKDYLSFLDEHVLYAYGNRTLAQVAKEVLSLTDYPKEEDGDPKIITGPELDAFNTAITLSETEDDSISAKEHLQTIAHACGVQMYIDRGGYIHLNNDKRGVGAVYDLPLSQQGEEPEHRKEQMPKKVVVTLNSEYGDPVETDLNGGGETMTVENPFIVTTAEGETLSEIVYDHFIKYRNTADIPYRGEPALDILDTITLGTEFGGDVEAIVVGTELEFDGTLSGSLSVRYQLGGNTPEKVQIKGSGNFIYPLGVDDEPSITSFDLVCETTFPTPTYQWSYFTVSNGSWLNIAGATSNTLSVAYNSSYYNNDSSVKFRCVVNDTKGAITQISKIQLQKSEKAGYRGVQKKATKEEIDVPSPQIGDVVLLDNTDNANASVYGEAHVYDGEKWVSTEESDALAMTYKDALQLAEDTEKTIYASKIFTDLLVANKGFITNLFSQNIKLLGGGSVYSDYYLPSGEINPSATAETGLYLSAEGLAQLYRAILTDVIVKGKVTINANDTPNSGDLDDSNAVLKTSYGLPGEDLPTLTHSRWRGADACSTVYGGATGTASYDGTSYSYFRVTSASQLMLIRIGDSSGGAGSTTGNITRTIQETGAYRLRVNGAGGVFAEASSYVKVYRNGNVVYSISSKYTQASTYFTFNAGDTVRVETNQHNAYLYIYEDGIALSNDSYVTFKFINNSNMAFTKRFIIGFWDSNDHMTMTTIAQWADELTPVDKYVACDIDNSSFTYNGVDYTPTYVMKTGTSFIVLTTSGANFTFSRTVSTAEKSTQGWFWLSGSIVTVSELRGLITDTLLPNTEGVGEVGKDIGGANKRYRTMYGIKGDFEQMKLGTSSLSASGYTKLPNGMMLQWVSLSLGADNEGLNVTFPIAFSTACVFATIVSSWTGKTTYGWDYVRNISTTGCTCVTQAGNPRLIAIGY